MIELLFEASLIQISESVLIHCDQRGNEIKIEYLVVYSTADKQSSEYRQNLRLKLNKLSGTW